MKKVTLPTERISFAEKEFTKTADAEAFLVISMIICGKVKNAISKSRFTIDLSNAEKIDLWNNRRSIFSKYFVKTGLLTRKRKNARYYVYNDDMKRIAKSKQGSVYIGCKGAMNILMKFYNKCDGNKAEDKILVTDPETGVSSFMDTVSSEVDTLSANVMKEFDAIDDSEELVKEPVPDITTEFGPDDDDYDSGIDIMNDEVLFKLNNHEEHGIKITHEDEVMNMFKDDIKTSPTVCNGNKETAKLMNRFGINYLDYKDYFEKEDIYIEELTGTEKKILVVRYLEHLEKHYFNFIKANGLSLNRKEMPGRLRKKIITGEILKMPAILRYYFKIDGEPMELYLENMEEKYGYAYVPSKSLYKAYREKIMRRMGMK